MSNYQDFLISQKRSQLIGETKKLTLKDRLIEKIAIYKKNRQDRINKIQEEIRMNKEWLEEIQKPEYEIFEEQFYDLALDRTNTIYNEFSDYGKLKRIRLNKEEVEKLGFKDAEELAEKILVVLLNDRRNLFKLNYMKMRVGLDKLKSHANYKEFYAIADGIRSQIEKVSYVDIHFDEDKFYTICNQK